MATYKVKPTIASAKQWRSFVNGGDLSGALANILAGTVISGVDAGSTSGGVAVLKRTDVEPDTYVKKVDFDLVSTPPPPPPTTESRVITITIAETGWQTVSTSIIQNKNAG